MLKAGTSDPVYPRERGEQGRARRLERRASGLSPRTRGTVLVSALPASASRFIPANAGNSCLLCPWPQCFPVYPRERGEQPARQPGKRPTHGLSPRTRGTANQQPTGRVHDRFIPANAGNSSCGYSGSAGASVYPRERGEQRSASSFFCSASGLSPRTRGTATHRQHWIGPNRFIPANAGNSGPQLTQPAFHAVYPRERGEQSRR